MKRLITCSDGTWDKPDDTTKDGKPLDSNVCLFYQSICSLDANNIRQLKIYDTGVGTGFSLKDKILGGVTGMGIDKKIKNIYTFLMLNYEPGDDIFLFGFSRGAYTARSLAGFIRNCGILKPGYIHLVDKAYELYRDRNDYTNPDSDLMVSFRANYCFENITPIKFIGVWDTVGSLGIPLPWYKFYNQERYQFHDTTLSSYVKNAYQALAVDERRKLFEPVLWEESEKVTKGIVTSQTMEQRWFPGVHCNVGGGYEDRGLSDRTLDWMIKKAELSGLCIDTKQLAGLNIPPVSPNFMGVLRNSYTWEYWFWFKVWREIELRDDRHEEIDGFVIERIKADKSYRPGNLKDYIKKYSMFSVSA